MRGPLFGWVLTGLLLLMAPVALGTERTPDEVSRMTRQISQEIYSPYCPGKNLAMCPSSNALEARMEIQSMASQGMSEEEIKGVFHERYGDEVRMNAPPARDNYTLLGALFGGFLLAVLAVGVLAKRRLSSGEELQIENSRAEKESGEDLADDSYLDELRAEIND